MAKEIKPAGQVPEGYVRFNGNIRKENHKRLKVYSAMTGKAMNEIFEEWIEKYTPELPS